MIEEQSEILRVRLPKRLFADIRKNATALKLRPPEVARLAIARGMVGMTPTTTKQPRSEAGNAHANS